MSIERTSDFNDLASEREDEEREYRIAEARRTIPIVPDLGCMDCQGIAHDVAKTTCDDFRVCLADWEQEQRMKKIKGNPNVE